MWNLFRRKPQVSPFPLNEMKQRANDCAAQDGKHTVSSATSEKPPSESLLKQEVETLYIPLHEHFFKEDSRLSSVLDPLAHDLKKYDSQLNKIREDLKWRPLQVYIPLLIYVAIVVFLVATEFSFNFKVFSTVMRESLPAAAALAIGTTGVVLAIAHFAGLIIRHGKIVMGTILIFICVLVIAVFAGVRIGDIQYEQYQKQGSGETLEDMRLNSPLTDSQDNAAVSQEKKRIIFDYISHFNLVALFFLINLCFLIVGILCSFYSHDPDKNYQSVSKLFSKTLKKVSMIFHQRRDNANSWENTYREFTEQYQHIIEVYRTKVEQLVGEEIIYIRIALKNPKEDERYFPLNLPKPNEVIKESVMKDIQTIFENPMGNKSSQVERPA